MTRDTAVMLATLTIPAVLVEVFPSLVHLSVVLLFAGGATVTIVSLRSLLRQDRRGLFLQYLDPDKLERLRPNSQELTLFKGGICSVVSALLVMFLSDGKQLLN